MKQVLFLFLLITGIWAQTAQNQISCPQGQLPFAGQCKPITYILGCAIYTSDSQCQTCEYGYLLNQGRCLPNSNQTQDCCAAYASDGTCKQCSNGLYSVDPFCYRNEIFGCILKKDSSCLVCGQGLSLSNGICVLPIANCAGYNNFGECTSCAANYKLINNFCYYYPQVANCKNLNEFGCVQCNNGFYLTSNRSCENYAAGCLKYWQQKCVACHPRFQMNQNQCWIWGCKSYNWDGCKECQQGYQLEDGKCYYNGCQQIVNNTCVQCKKGLRLSANGCVQPINYTCKQCAQGYIFVGEKCVKAIFGCQQYNTNGLCTQCSQPFQLTVNGQCQILGCKSYCSQGCQQCNAPFILENGVCSIKNCAQYVIDGCSACQNGYLLVNKQCYPKDVNCLSYDTNNMPSCLSCAQKYYLFQGVCKPAEKGCVYDSQGVCKCKNGFSLNSNGKCEIVGCSSYDWQTCLSCSSPFTYNPQNKICYIDHCKQYTWKGCGSCESGWVLVNGICKTGDPYCLSYSSQGICLTCQSGFILSGGCCYKNIQNCAQFSPDHLSCVQCQTGFTLYNNLCKQVLTNCKTMNFDSNSCSVCNSGYHLLTGKCVVNDVSCLSYKKYQDNTSEYCCQCKSGFFYSPDKNLCLKEEIGCVYMGSNCVACSKPFLFDQQQSNCYIPGCQKYSDCGCLTCSAPFTLINQTCLIGHCSAYSRQTCTQCDAGYMLTNSGLCVVINPNCLSYSGSQCIKCKDGFVLNDGNCVVKDQNCITYGQSGIICTTCCEGYYPDQSGKCRPKQPGCLYQNGCCSACSLPFIFDSQTKTCKINNCLQYNSLGCLNCQAPFALQSDKSCGLENCARFDSNGCLQCKPLFHLKNKSCLADNPNCLMYNSNGLCEVCADNFVLSSNGQCVQGSVSCLEYCSSDRSKCLTCADNYFLNRYFQCEKKDDKCVAYTNGVCSLCKDKYFLYSQICFPYTAGCVKYNGKDCTQCKVNYILKNGECFDWKNQGMILLGDNDHYDFDITPIDVRQSKYYIDNLSPASALGKFFFSSYFNASYQDCTLSTLEGANGKGWKSQIANYNQFIGITITGEPVTFYALQLQAVQGNYITQFYLEYSVDGVNFITVESAFTVSDSIKTNLTTIYFTGIYAQAIRIKISGFKGWPACRIEFFYYDLIRFRKISNLKSLTYLQDTINSNFIDRVDNQIYINQAYFFNPSASCSIKQMCFTGLQLCDNRQITGLALTFQDPSSYVSEFYLTYSVDGRKYNCYNNCMKFTVDVKNSCFTMKLDVKAQGVRIYPTNYKGTPKFSPTFFYD